MSSLGLAFNVHHNSLSLLPFNLKVKQGVLTKHLI